MALPPNAFDCREAAQDIIWSTNFLSSFGYTDKQCRHILIYLEDGCGIPWPDWRSLFGEMSDEEVREIAREALDPCWDS